VRRLLWVERVVGGEENVRSGIDWAGVQRVILGHYYDIGGFGRDWGLLLGSREEGNEQEHSVLLVQKQKWRTGVEGRVHI